MNNLTLLFQCYYRFHSKVFDSCYSVVQNAGRYILFSCVTVASELFIFYVAIQPLTAFQKLSTVVQHLTSAIPKFSSAIQLFDLIHAKIFLSRSAVQPHLFEHFLQPFSRSTSSVENFFSTIHGIWFECMASLPVSHTFTCNAFSRLNRYRKEHFCVRSRKCRLNTDLIGDQILPAAYTCVYLVNGTKKWTVGLNCHTCTYMISKIEPGLKCLVFTEQAASWLSSNR